MFIALVENKSLSGVFNGVAPNPKSSKNQLFADERERGRELGKPLILPNAPAFVIKLLFGEMDMLLGSQHIFGKKNAWIPVLLFSFLSAKSHSRLGTINCGTIRNYPKLIPTKSSSALFKNFSIN